MSLTYDKDKSGVEYRAVHASVIKIRTPVPTPEADKDNVSVTYQTLDSDGKVVGSPTSVTLNVEYLVDKYGKKLVQAYKTIREIIYQEAVDSAGFPPGGTIDE